jgi:hypothetical protein
MVSTPTGIRIIGAREQSLAEINALIARAKAHWRWPTGYLEQELPLHREDGILRYRRASAIPGTRRADFLHLSHSIVG